VLLDSILRQWKPEFTGNLEICISDNASRDETADTVARYQAKSPVPIKYFRYEANQGGVRNFVNVVRMATAEYCWLVGSDDALTHDSIEGVLKVLVDNPSVAGVTLNKLNFNKSLDGFVGIDHQSVLPPQSDISRCLTPFSEIAGGIAMLF